MTECRRHFLARELVAVGDANGTVNVGRTVREW